MISGTMPKWQQRFHAVGFWIMCIFFAGFGLFNLQMLRAVWGSGAPKASLPFALLFVAFCSVAIGGQRWFRRRIVIEFTYDGYTFQFRTLGVPATQTRAVSEIAYLREWRGRGGALGYRIGFLDRQKIYLQYGVTNAVAVAEQIRSRLETESAYR
jgi:hypothetical protein